MTGHGRSLYTRHWAAASPSSDAFLCIHGVESHGGWFEPLATELSAEGFTTFAYDRIGFGASAGPKGDMDSLKHCLGDLYNIRHEINRHHQRVHLIALSFGGVLAAMAAIKEPRLFASWHFVTPGWFPKKTIDLSQLTPRDIWSKKALMPVPLKLQPQDFSRQQNVVNWISQDPLRNRSITLRFAWHAAVALAFVRRRFGSIQSPHTNLYLAANDRIIHNRKTKNLWLRHGAPENIRVYPHTDHCLVREVPSLLAQDIIANVQGKAFP